MNEGDKLSLAEEEFLGIIIHASVNESGQHANMHDFKALRNGLFRSLYPLYVRNRDGYFPQKGPYGEIPYERRMQDVAFLEEEYQKWTKVIASGKYTSASLQHLANEVKRHLEDINAFAKQAQQGSRLTDARVKEIVLHSKYLLIFVDEYYQELKAQEQIVNFAGGKIIFDSYGYIHTLFRHYAQHIKSYQTDKSYHFDMGFDHEDLPNILRDIVISYFRNLPNKSIEDDRIFVRIRGQLYALWFRKMTRTLKGGVKDVYYRFQTFYPVISQKDLLYASTLNEILSDDGIVLFYK